ncbi:hypothetical protein LJK88_25495 [Paenibacillus sp. P26]|nr:hypothetical protein LJK88_25495 [Paenibacillus sp. P26]UUZ95228.1 hypothetical protein LJK87_12480 [Paenibacillus sp. P25]
MFILLRAVLWVFILFRWGDWRNWRKYQSSILFVIAGNFLYNFLCHDYSMWEYPPNTIFHSHTAVSLFYDLTINPGVVILYLGLYPTKVLSQLLWISFWVFIYAVVEWIELQIGEITYHNGWNFMWSVLLMGIAVPMIRLHDKKPLWAYGISIFIVIGLVKVFEVPIAK